MVWILQFVNAGENLKKEGLYDDERSLAVY